MDLKNYRRKLHKLAEIGQNLPKTRQFIINALENCGCKISFPWESAVAAFFDYGCDSTIALRADMDALPITEAARHDYRSDVEGCMHACGHDGHMAMLLGVADGLAAGSIKTKYNILLIFQPAEETIGGAENIIESGIFERLKVCCVFGMHLMPDLEKSILYTRVGALMAKSCEITVDINGVSAHIAKAYEGIDTIPAAAGFINELYRKIDLLSDIQYKLLRFGKLTSGTVRNALSANTHIEGSLRCFSENDFEKLVKTTVETLNEIDATYNTNSSIHLGAAYPPVINDKGLVKRLQDIINVRILDKPFMLADDFSYYQKKVPGVYIYLGTGTGIPLHSPDFDFDEDILKTGVEAYIKIIENL